MKVVKSIGSLFRKAVDFSGFFRDVSKGLKIASHVSKGPDILLGVVSAQKAVDDIRHIIDRTKKPTERIKSSFEFILHVDSIMNTVATICKIIAAAAVSAKNAIQWIPIFNMVSFAVGFISLGLSSFTVHKGRKLYGALNDSMKEYQNAGNDDEKKISALTKALTIIEEEGIQPLRKHLMISKVGGIELTKRVDSLKFHIQNNIIDANDEKFIKLLVGRAKTQLSLQVSDIATSVGSIAGGAFMVAPVPIAAQIAGTVILATTGVVSLVTWGIRYFFINKNPFDPSSKTRAVAMLDALSKGLRALKQRLQTFGLGKKKLAGAAT